jgi:hypothetical protein
MVMRVYHFYILLLIVLFSVSCSKNNPPASGLGKLSTGRINTKVCSAAVRNILSNCPMSTLDGENISIRLAQIRMTSESIEIPESPGKGIICRFDAVVGDSYSCEDGKRTVTGISSSDDSRWGNSRTKVITVEEISDKPGIRKIVYHLNNEKGLIGLELTFDDSSIVSFPVDNGSGL